MRGTVSWEWKGGGDGNLHSSVVAPTPHGFAAAGIFRRKETATPTRNTSSPAKAIYEPIDDTKFQPAKASGKSAMRRGMPARPKKCCGKNARLAPMNISQKCSLASVSK